MDQYEALRKYQEADLELERYEKEMRGSKNRKELLRLREFLLEQQNALKKIEGDVEIMGDRAEALSDEVKRMDSAISSAVRQFEEHPPEDEEEAEDQLGAMQKLVATITRYETEIAKLRKDSDTRDRQQKEIRVRSAKARAEFDKLKTVYDEEYKAASVKQAELRARVEEQEKGIDPALLKKYKAIKKHTSPAITGLHDGRCGGCNMQLPAADMNRIHTGSPYVECENCGRIILVAGA